ncbi:unnamed protein product (macronuclear) [Paramecium tetraurelia]|uniref:Potassium channel domain-containing protein n=1 Tax=Paramecium tetraurelia TaxID=5888 RepID=A0BZE0_PARTE|nr:uncharacterized protein GSPATT00033760001 [Paramecium tetraurelia]CAK63907.1 unnamed protein product [Paramecium tetraurelia]|eukprot:XP_001431305.1 hypothetical protein (macronuclear) [Paramecium tetraurelia strain d4-2]
MQDKMRVSTTGAKLFTEGNQTETQPFRQQIQGQQSSGGESLMRYQRMLTQKSERKTHYVQQFCSNLKSQTNRFGVIPEEYVSFIGDKTSYRNSSTFNIRLMHKNFSLQLELKFFEKIRQFFSRYLNKLIQCLKRIELFQPESSVKLIWDSASLVSRLYFLFLIPLDIAWSKYSFMFDMYNLTSFIFQMVLLGDLIVGLNTAFYNQGQLVTDRKQIVYHNFLKCFGLEWTSTIQLLVYQILTQDPTITQYIKDYKIYLTLVTFLVHYSTIQECLEYYEEGLNLSKKASSIIELVKLIAVLFFIIHMFSCFWFWVGDYSHNNYGVSWLENIVDKEWEIQYLSSVYYSTVTMFTIGYGDVLPQSNLERIVCCLFIIMASLQLPYSINTVGAIISKISEYGEDKKRKLRIINSYMQKKRIPFPLQSEIRQYLNYYWQLNKEKDADEAAQMINQLSENLKERLTQESNSVILNQCALFRYRFTPAFKRELIKSLKTKILAPETIVGDKKELVYIESGTIDMYGDQQCNLKLQSFNANQTIGLIPFVTGKLQPETYKSQGFCLLMTLSHRKFKKTLKDFPNDYEIYCQMKDYLLFNGNETTIFPRKCYACQSYKHYSHECPVVHYVPDREKIIKKHTISTTQQRKRIPRQENRRARYPSRKHSQQSLIRASFIVQQENQNIVKLYDIPYVVEEEAKIHSLNSYQSIKNKPKHNDETRKQIMARFKNLVKKITLIDKYYPQFMMTILKKFRHNQNYFSQQSQLKQLKIRYDHIKQLTKVDPQLLNDIDDVIRINSEYDICQNQEFETPKNFIHYNPKFNFNNVKLKIDKSKMRILNEFQRYCLFPAVIMRKFHSTKTTQDLITYKRRKNVFMK